MELYGIDKDSVQRLNALFQGAVSVTVAAHPHPDGDALGSVSGLVSYLRKCRGKDAVAVLPDSPAATVRFIVPDSVPLLCLDADREACLRRIGESDLIVLLDANGFSRTEGLKEAFEASKAPKVLIDHHIGPERDRFQVVFSTPDVSSASELLYYILKELPDIDGDASKLPADAARALLTGMTTDTNNFANSVFPSTFEMASRMLEAGVDRDGILAELYNRNRENRLRMTGHLLKDNMRIFPNGVSCIVVRRADIEEYDIRDGETEGIVNMPLTLDKVRMSIFLREDEGFFRVSIRSKRGTSAFRLASTRFHGGGHEQAAGGRLYFPGDIADASMAEAFLERITDDYFKTEE